MASEKMKLYWSPECRSVRNIWLIKEMGVESDIELCYYRPGKDADADAIFSRDVHTHCTIPALVIPGGRTMLESGAICLYLADLYGKLVPEPKDRRDYYDFALYANVTLDELMDYFYSLKVMKEEFPKEKQERMMVRFRTCMEYLSKHLEGKKYICGDVFTAADCILGYDLFYATLINDGELLRDYKEILDYFKRLQSRKAYQEAVAMTA